MEKKNMFLKGININESTPWEIEHKKASAEYKHQQLVIKHSAKDIPVDDVDTILKDEANQRNKEFNTNVNDDNEFNGLGNGNINVFLNGLND